MTTGFRLDELAKAFDRVMDPHDWQAPIRSSIPVGERQVVEAAVLLFTDTHAAFEAAPGKAELLIVTAPGYRSGFDCDSALVREDAHHCRDDAIALGAGKGRNQRDRPDRRGSGQCG